MPRAASCSRSAASSRRAAIPTTARPAWRRRIRKRWQRLDTGDKATRVFQFHDNTLKALRDLLCAAGLEHPGQLGPEHILRRVSPIEVRSLAALYRFLEPGELLSRIPEHAVFKDFWALRAQRQFRGAGTRSGHAHCQIVLAGDRFGHRRSQKEAAFSGGLEAEHLRSIRYRSLRRTRRRCRSRPYPAVDRRTR